MEAESDVNAEDERAGESAEERFSVAIMAGGFGKRLGQEKARAPAAGRPLLHWTAAAVAPWTDDLLVVRRADQELAPAEGIAWREVVDGQAERGPLAGIEAALAGARYELVLIFACDMPLLRPALVRWLAGAAAGVDVAIPVIEGREEPLAAAYRVGCLGAVRSALAAGKGRPIAILPELRVRRLTEAELRAADPGLASLTNVNYPEDLERVERELAARAEARSGAR